MSSQITYNNGSTSTNAVFQYPLSRDELPNPFDISEEDDDSNGQLQRRDLFQSLQNNSSYASLNASSKSGTSSRPQPDPSKLNTMTRKPNDSISSTNSAVPSTYSNHSESSQQNSSMDKALPPNPKRKEFTKSMMSMLKSKKLKNNHHDTTNDFGQLVITPVDLPSVTSSSKMMNGNGVSPQVKETPESLSNSTSDSVDVVVYPKDPKFLSTSLSDRSFDVPMIQPSVTQTSQFHGDSVIHNGDNLDAQQKTSEMTNPWEDSTPITQPLLVPSKALERDIAVVKEISIPEEFVSDKPSTSPNTQSLPLNSTTSTPLQSPPLNSTTSTSPNIQGSSLNSTTTDSNPISPKDNNSVLNSTTTDSDLISPKNNSPVLNSTTTDSNHISPKDNSATSTSSDTQSPSLNSTTTDSSPKDNSLVRKSARRGPDMSSFLLNLAASQNASKEVPDNVKPPRTQPWGPSLRSLQRISETGDSLPSDVFTPAPDDVLARKMEELGRLRRMESRNLLAQSTTSPETPTSSRTTASPKAEVWPQLQTLQEDSSSDVATMLRDAYKERQQSLLTQLDKALADLRDVQAENKRLKSENQSQQLSISQLKTDLETKREQDKSLTQVNNQLRIANSSLALLNKEKKGWQDKLDSMQHKVSAAERQVRCLDHLTRQKLESRQESGYGQPKRRGQFATTPASTDVIGAMRAMNEEIYQACVQFVEGLERTSVFSTSQKPEVQKMLGNHLTTMMEDQAKTATSDGYNMLLMQTVLEVFMTHWCSSIIEAFYPEQETFADLLVQLSAQTSNTSGK